MNGWKAIFQTMYIDIVPLDIDIGQAPTADFTDPTAMDEAHPDQAVVPLRMLTPQRGLQQLLNFGRRQVFAIFHSASSCKCGSS